MNLKTSAHKLYQDKDTAANFDEEGEGEGCPCCPAITMSPAMMQNMNQGHMGHDHSGHDHFEDEEESRDSTQTPKKSLKRKFAATPF